MKKVLFMFAVIGLVSCGTTETTEETTTETTETACASDCTKECCSKEGVTGTTGAVEASSLQDVMPAADVTVTDVEATDVEVTEGEVTEGE